MHKQTNLLIAFIALAGTLLACSTFADLGVGASSTQSPLSGTPITRGDDEPVLVTGSIPFTSPFFLSSSFEPFVLLEDESGFVNRNRDFVFPLNGQAIGPVDQVSDSELKFSLTLPSVPQGTFVDVDNNGQTDQGVMVFVVAYWSNTWDGPFLEERDGTGWSNAYVSTTTDPNREDEIDGGTMVIWSPDDQQSFPTDFGEDNKLFTEDDPVAVVPAGYSFVDLDASPFRVYKQSTLDLTLNEGESALKDYSAMSYTDAFDALFNKVSVEYPFTDLKGLDWNAIYSQVAPEVAAAGTDTAFHKALRDFQHAIPDEHVGLSFDAGDFYPLFGGGFGLILDQLDDGSVVVRQVLQQVDDQRNGTVQSPAAAAGIQPGAKIISWAGRPVAQALNAVIPFFNAHSTPQAKLLDQLIYLTRVPQDSSVEVTFQNPGAGEKTVTMDSALELEFDPSGGCIGFPRRHVRSTGR